MIGKRRKIQDSESPLVSIVMIFLNGERFLKEAVDSVLCQTYSNWELLLVDDGSTDKSTLLATDICKRYPQKIRYLEHNGHANLGMSASRNAGIKEAKGSYVTFLDADDVWLPNNLTEHTAILQENPHAAMVYGPVLWWYSWSGRPQDRYRDYLQHLGVEANTLVSPPVLLTLFLQHKAGVPSGMMLRRELVEEAGGFENEFRGAFEDQVFCSKICLNYPVFTAETCTYLYRQHANNSCKSTEKEKVRKKRRDPRATGQAISPRLIFLDWLAAYLREQETTDSRVWNALRNARWQELHPTLSVLLQPRRLAQEVAAKLLPISLHRRLRALWYRQHPQKA
ncbi:MAG: glycosyltransferase family 2 protein [Opitutales bacterium]